MDSSISRDNGVDCGYPCLVPTAFIGTDVTDDFGSCSRLEVVSTMFGVGVYNGIGVGSLLLAVTAPFNAGTPSLIEKWSTWDKN